MASKASTAAKGWVKHHGNGRPVPIGTLVDVLMFNGVIRTIVAGTGTHDLNGDPIPDSQSAGWSGWIYDDGGPIGPKFKSYRVIVRDERRERNAAMFRSWLNVRERELA